MAFINRLAAIHAYSNLLHHLPQLLSMPKCKQMDVAH